MKILLGLLLAVLVLVNCQVHKQPSINDIKTSVLGADFLRWKDHLYKKALNKHYDKALLERVFVDISFSKKALIQDKKQFKKQSFEQYYHNAVNNLRIKKARKRVKKYQKILTQIEHKYQVPKSYIVALWAVESNFGKRMGDFDIMNALANLAYEGRRRKFFEKEFFAALDILQQNNVKIKNFKGSWAGAMGQCQFMPTTYLQYAVDYNHDGKKDIWHNKADVFASIANYLSSYKWQMHVPWGYEVTAQESLLNIANNNKYYRLGNLLKKYQIHKLNNKKARFADHELFKKVKIISYNNRFFIVFKNFNIIKRWNNSNYFALTIGLLADKIN